MCHLDEIIFKKATYQDRSLIASSPIKSINKEVIPSLFNISPSNSVISSRKLKDTIVKELNKNKLKYLKSKDINDLQLNQLKEYEFKSFIQNGKENEFLNKKYKIDNSPIANHIKYVYCIYDKYCTKIHILKAIRPENTDITPTEILAIYTRGYQKLFKQQEQFFNAKKLKIGIQNSPTGIISFGIQDLRYNGQHTIIVFNDFIVCSFDVEKLPTP